MCGNRIQITSLHSLSRIVFCCARGLRYYKKNKKKNEPAKESTSAARGERKDGGCG